METRAKIVEILESALNIGHERMLEIGDDDLLISIGMDSINCVDVVLNIEDEFGVSFSDEELLLDNLNTLNKLCKIVEQKLENLVA